MSVTLPNLPPAPANPTYAQSMERVALEVQRELVIGTHKLAEAQAGMLEVARAHLALLQQQVSEPPAPPAPVPASVDAMVALVSSMTSAQRQNPAAAADAALAQWNAITARL